MYKFRTCSKNSRSRTVSSPFNQEDTAITFPKPGFSKPDFRKRDNDKNAHQINRQIRAAYVRVIGKEGEQLGILDTRQARELAENLGLDLVNVSPTSDPPVCKIMDYGKFKYEEKKKAQAAKKKQIHVEVKEVQLRPKTDVHDLEHKAKSTVGFLEEGNKTKVTVFYRGRELQHASKGWDTLIEFAQKLNDRAVLESPPRMEGKRLWCLFGPIPPGKKVQAGHLLASFPKMPGNLGAGFVPGGFRGRPGQGPRRGPMAQQAAPAAPAATPAAPVAPAVPASTEGGDKGSSGA
jgi:translation initiation factor IF-3